MRLSTVFAVAVGAILLVACGSDATPSGGPDKKLSDLSATEQTDFCATNGEAFQAIATGSCTLVGLDAPTQAECETARDECTSMAPTSGVVCDFSACLGTIEAGCPALLGM
jgi:hypothetical protein